MTKTLELANVIQRRASYNNKIIILGSNHTITTIHHFLRDLEIIKLPKHSSIYSNKPAERQIIHLLSDYSNQLVGPILDAKYIFVTHNSLNDMLHKAFINSNNINLLDPPYIAYIASLEFYIIEHLRESTAPPSEVMYTNIKWYEEV